MASYLGNQRSNISSSSSNPRRPDLSPGQQGLGAGTGRQLGTMPILHIDASFGSDLPQEEAVTKLQDLMRENHELKSTVRENNLMMISLQKVLVEMKTNWDLEQEESRKKFEQAKTIVLTLRRDVETKKTRLETLQLQVEQLSKAESSGSKTTKDQLDLLGAELEQSKANLNSMKKEREIHTKEMDNLKIKIEQNQKRNVEANNEIQRVESQLREKVKECESLENKLSKVIQHNKKLLESKQKPSLDIQGLHSDRQNQLQGYQSGSSTEDMTDAGSNKQTHRKYLQGQSGQEDQSEDEKRSLAKYEEEKRGEDTGTEQQQALKDTREELELERHKVSDLQAEIHRLSLSLEERSHEIHAKDESLSHLRCSLSERNLKQEQLQKEVDSMQRHLHHSTSYQSALDPRTENIKAQVISLLHEVTESNSKLESANSKAQRYQKRFEELEQKCSAMQEELDSQRSKDDHMIEALRGAVANTEASLATQKELNDKKSSMIEDKTIQIQELQKECSTLKYQLDEHRQKASLIQSATSDGTIVMTISQKRELDEKIDNLTAQLLNVEDQLLSKQQENQKLQQKLIILRTESEDIPYLKAQIESYKSDFEAERKCGEYLRREKRQAQEEIENLRLFIQQLKGEIGQLSAMHHHSNQPWNSGHRDRMRGRQYPGGGYDECDIQGESGTGDKSSTGPGRVPTEHSVTEEAGAQVATQAKTLTYECPKCGLKTQDIDSMTIHVDECIQDTN